MVFFIVPNVDGDPSVITGATATMVVFAALLACVGQFSSTVAALRESAWGAYLRTLPVGLRPLVVSQLLTGMITVTAAVVPIVVVGAVFTEASVPPSRLLLGMLALLVAAVVFTLLGLAIGYTMTLRASEVVNSVLVQALAVGGGVFFIPGATPSLIGTVAPFLPTRGTTDLVLAALTDHEPDPLALITLAVWTAALLAITVWGHHRAELRRFR